ncbi:type IV pilus biogenesis protein PilM [Paenibacillus lutimineralis]|uniref:Pilus assembly protein PilM n=1 Tax=Paenibacillus lutimineralis TaxID=2707005 RepID=A0A3S9UT73_9BACL|nr:hypothetical protein [Paenibacillus lutimineralis]AZS13515.1 hypothetical protein EI981_02840 [Paenibacillus lutimineralis]
MVYDKRSSSIINRWTRPAGVGVTVEEEGVRFVQIDHKLGTVTACDFLPLPSLINEEGWPELTVHLHTLQAWLERYRLSGSKAHLAAPTAQSFIRILRVPKVRPRQQRQVTALEIEGSLRFPFEQPIIDYHWIDERPEDLEKGMQPTFVAAVPRPLIVEMVDVLGAVGLHIESVDLGAIALSRILQRQNRLEQECVMVIFFKEKEAEVYLYNRGIPDFIRTFSLEQVSEDSLNNWRYSEIVSSVTRIINFYEYTLHEGGERISTIILAGSAPDKETIKQQLNTAFGQVNVLELDVQEYFTAVSSDCQDSYAIALGLALKGARQS